MRERAVRSGVAGQRDRPRRRYGHHLPARGDELHEDVGQHALVANTANVPGDIRVTLHFENGATVSKTLLGVAAQTRTTVAVVRDPASGLVGDSDFRAAFSQAELTAGKRFGVVVESLGTEPVPIVVERAMYRDADGVRWAAGSNAPATRIQ